VSKGGKWLSEWQAQVFTSVPNMQRRTIRARLTAEPRIAIVLGSGLGGFADDFEEPVGIPYHEIPGFPRSTVEGHSGRLVAARSTAVQVLAMQGRVHYYEGYSLEEVTFPVRTLKLLGIKTLGFDECRRWH
jgi:purine-nucleoside phosphorylase